jgi:hypothetical protein
MKTGRTASATLLTLAVISIAACRNHHDAGTASDVARRAPAPATVQKNVPVQDNEPSTEGSDSSQHAVLIHFHLSGGKLGSSGELTSLQDLEGRLEAAISRAGTGVLDENEIGEGEYVIYAYGPDADALYSSIAALLHSAQVPKGSFAIKRYGSADDEDAKEVRVDL